MESGQDHRHGGGAGVRDAALYVPLPRGDLRKIQVVVKGAILQERLPFCNRKEAVIQFAWWQKNYEFWYSNSYRFVLYYEQLNWFHDLQKGKPICSKRRPIMILRAKTKLLFQGKPLTEQQQKNSELNIQELRPCLKNAANLCYFNKMAIAAM